MDERRQRTVAERKAKKRRQRRIQRMIQFFMGIIMIVVVGVVIAVVVGNFGDGKPGNQNHQEQAGGQTGGNKEDTTPEETTTEIPTKPDGTVIKFSGLTYVNEIVPEAPEQSTGESENESDEGSAGGESGGSVEVGATELGDLYAGAGFTEDFLTDLSTKHLFVIDATAGEVLLQKNAYTKTGPASTTKIITALTAMEYLDFSEIITVGEEIELIDGGSSVAALKQGQQLTFEDMLYALMIPSGNDAAYTIAVAAGRKAAGDATLSIDAAVSKFIDLMNENVGYMGLVNTHFMTPDGVTADGQYTCAADMARIAQWAIKDERLSEICSTYKKRIVSVTGEDVTYSSTNELMNPDSEYYLSCVTGLKTGSTSAAGKCLVSSATYDGKTVICVALNDTEEGRWQNSKTIYETAFGISE